VAQRPKVDKLPAEIRDAAYGLLRAGKTVDEILAHLQGLGADVSRSGVGRWKKTAEKSMQALKRAQALGEGWAKSLTEDPEGKVGRLLIELGKTAVLDNMLAQSDDGEDGAETRPIDTKDLYFLSAAVKNYESAGNLNIAREIKIRKEAVEKAAKAVESVAKAGGMTADTIAKLRAAVIGTAA
jgi:hypothetical protein